MNRNLTLILFLCFFFFISFANSAEAAFDPSSISGMQLWLKADAIAGVSNGSTFSTWNDSSSAGNNFTTTGGFANPTYKTNIANGLPSVYISFSSQMSAGSSTAFNFLHQTNGGTVITAFRSDNTNNAGGNPLLGTRGAGGNIGYALFVHDAATNEGPMSKIVGNASAQVSTQGNAVGILSANTFYTVSDVVDPGNSTASSRSTIRTNGTNLSASNTQTGTPSTSNSNVALGIGGNGSGGSGGDIDFLEVLIYNTKLTATQVNRVESYLGQKYAISVTNSSPPVISSVASSTTQTTATITWITDEAATSTVNYGTTSSYGTASTSASLVTSHSITLTGLTIGTTYHFQVGSSDGNNATATSSDLTFTTSPAADTTPPVISSVASSTTQTTATITWTTDENATSTVNYGATSSYGTASTSASLVTSHSITLTGLTASTLYHYQVGSSDASGNVATSSDLTFTTSALSVTPPTLTIQAASSVSTSTATLNGTITSNNNASSTIEGFNYGLTTSYGSVASASGTFNTGAFSQALTGLTPSTTYHFQAFATNSSGIGTSSDLTFTTSALPDTTPPVISSVASSTTQTTATITWTTDENATSTVNYGTTSSYGTASSSSAFSTSHSIVISGLSNSTTYHFQIAGSDARGNLATSSDLLFTTAGPSNIAPTANAGSDQTITLPTHSVTLSGAASTDPDGSIASYSWSETTSNFARIINSTSSAPTVTDLAYGTTTIQLLVTDNLGATSTANVNIIVRASTSTTPAKKIVILGSSTAAGSGATTYSNAWAGRYTTYVGVVNGSNVVTNLAVGGYTTRSIMPTGTGVGEDTAHNITAAIALHPDAIIVNMPANDVRNGYSVAETESNFTTITNTAAAAGIPIYIATMQPASDFCPGTQSCTNQITEKDWVLSTYGSRAVDFWTTVANADGTIVSSFGYGDGIHLNDNGHHVLYNRVAGSGLLESAFIPPVISSIASSTSQTTATITWITDEAATSTVNYGATSSYGTASTSASLVTSHSITLTGLTASTLYHFQVGSSDVSGNISTSSDQTLTTASVGDTTPPSVTITTPTGGSVLHGSVNLTANDSDSVGVTSLQFKLDGITNIGADGVSTSPYSVTWNSTGTSDGPHTIQAVAHDAAGNYATSSVSITVQNNAPIISSVASSTTQTTAAITWTTNNTASSTVNFGPTSGYGTASTSASLVTSHSIVLSGLSSSSLYHFQVGGTDLVGNISTSSDLTFTTSALPAPIISSVASSTSISTATITWTTDHNATSTVNYGTTSSYGTASSSDSLVTSHSITLVGLSSGTTYHFQVGGANSAGTVSTSSDMTFVTQTPDTTPPVLSSIASSTTDTTATITWTTDEGATSQIEYGASATYSASTSLDSALVTLHSVTISGLIASLTYHFRILSKDAPNNLAASSDQTFTTASAPTAPVPAGSNGGSIGYYVYSTHNPFANTNSSQNPSTPTTPPPSNTPAARSLSIAPDLQLGATSALVTLLQKFLNSHGFIVSSIGAGSPSHETDFFGTKTKAALLRFQRANHITPASGYFGPKTRAVIKGLI